MLFTSLILPIQSIGYCEHDALNLSPMTSLVTGATGFIGRHLVDHLTKQGEPVRALYRDEAKRRLYLGSVRMRSPATPATRP